MLLYCVGSSFGIRGGEVIEGAERVAPNVDSVDDLLVDDMDGRLGTDLAGLRAAASM